ncbi:hemerythrin domain-containing protein [Brachymonas sp.]|uniref:hemerythrin domain-containing protein n=1 Tax=unclassified Brachymonas TaxID=2621329 RepID=UPI0035B4F1D9
MATVSLSEPGRRANATFEDPQAMLEACHDRVQRMCTLLERLTEHAGLHGADTQARQAATDVMRYFDLAGPHHHQDEELHIFPVLLASGDTALIDTARTLHQQHVDMAALWQTVRAQLAALQAGDPAPLLADSAPATQFVTMYTAHIPLEEDVAYPAAFARIADGQRTTIGEEMAHRRQSPTAAAPSTPPAP